MFIVMHTYWNPAGGTTTDERVAQSLEQATSFFRVFLESELTIEVRIITSNPMPA
jgi:hypothetical protein